MISALRTLPTALTGGNRLNHSTATVVWFPCQGLLGVLAQRLLPWPAGVLLDELGNIGKPPRGPGAGIIHPVQDFERQRITYRGEFGIGVVPIAALGRCERSTRRLEIHFGEGLRACRRKVS